MRGSIEKIVKLSILFMFIFILSLLPETLVQAHSSILKTLPEGGEKLQESPAAIELWFADPVKLHTSTIKLIDSSDNNINIKTYIDQKNPTHIIGDVKEELPAGMYTAEVNVITLDGDIITEIFSFEILKELPKKNVGPLKLLKQTPNDGQIIKGSPKKIDLWFNQSTDLTAIGIFDKNQKPVQLKQPYTDPKDPSHIVVELNEPLEKGTYQVTWYARPSEEKSISQPDILDVFYFAVDEFTPIKNGGNLTPMNTTWLPHFTVKQLGYWLIFVGLALLFGSSFFNRFISKEVKEYRRWKLISLGLILITITGTVLLIFQQRLELPDLPLGEFFSLKYIWIPLVQVILLIVGYTFKKIELLAFGIALITVPFVMGHATYPRYGGFFMVIVNVLHLVAASVWLGGIFSLLLTGKKSEFSNLLNQVGLKFSKWAFVSLLVIISTGFIMTVQYVPSFSIESFLKSQWGKAITIKIVLTFLIAGIGYLQRNALKRLADQLINRFYRQGIFEIVYGILIVFFASLLVVSTPTEAEQGVYPQDSSYEKDVKVAISPLNPGLNVLTLDFKEELEIESVKVKIAMPPDYSIEYNAFKINERTFKITGNIIHSSGTLLMEVEAVKANGDIRNYVYTIAVPGEMSD